MVYSWEKILCFSLFWKINVTYYLKYILVPNLLKYEHQYQIE